MLKVEERAKSSPLLANLLIMSSLAAGSAQSNAILYLTRILGLQTFLLIIYRAL